MPENPYGRHSTPLAVQHHAWQEGHDAALAEIEAMKAVLASVREELRVGNRLYAELTDKCRQVENERDAALRELAELHGLWQEEHP